MTRRVVGLIAVVCFLAMWVLFLIAGLAAGAGASECGYPDTCSPSEPVVTVPETVPAPAPPSVPEPGPSIGGPVLPEPGPSVGGPVVSGPGPGPSVGGPVVAGPEALTQLPVTGAAGAGLLVLYGVMITAAGVGLARVASRYLG